MSGSIFFDHRMLSIIVAANNSSNASASNATNADDELLKTCALWRPAAFVHSVFLPLWLLALMAWCVSVWRNAQWALEIHRMLVWVPAIECVHAALACMHYLFCPWKLSAEKMAGAAWAVVTILKQPVILVCLMMAAKGWCITRRHLPSRELFQSALVVAFLYTCVIIEMSAPRVVALVPVLLATFVVFFVVIYFQVLF